jgi:hypothetical protein
MWDPIRFINAAKLPGLAWKTVELAGVPLSLDPGTILAASPLAYLTPGRSSSYSSIV